MAGDGANARDGASEIARDETTALPSPCPREATRDEWETWHASLSWEQQLRRGDLDPPPHRYSEADDAKWRARDELRRARRWNPDPFSYADARRDGPWPRVDQLEAPALSNTWRMDPASGYSPGGFARRTRPVPYRELAAERLPRRARASTEARLQWIVDAIAREEDAQRAALKHVLRERHGRLGPPEHGSTASAMAWSHLVASRCMLAALRDLAKQARVDLLRERPQLALF